MAVLERLQPVAPKTIKLPTNCFVRDQIDPSLSCLNIESSLSSFGRALKASGIELPRGQRSHVLRHTFASHFMMNKGNILVLQRILGYSDLKMTMKYAKFDPDHFKEAALLNPLTSLTRQNADIKI